ncbi:MAG: DUF1284 domain-containing protein [Clostridia bacterium]
MQYFIGVGYDPSFVENMTQILKNLETAPETPVRLILSADDICRPCIYNEAGLCKTAEKVSRFDKQVLRFLNAKSGDILVYREIRNRINQNIIAKKLTAELCHDCEWLETCLLEEEKYYVNN